MNNQLQIFKNEEFGEVRTIAINNEPYLMLTKEQALGYLIKTCKLLKMSEEETKELVIEAGKSIEIWTREAAEEAYDEFCEVK